MRKPDDLQAPETKQERREFLQRIGKYAAVTPPAITMMLSATTVPAHARGSGGGVSGGSSDGGISATSGGGDPPAPARSNKFFEAPAQREESGRTEAGDRS